MGKMESLASFYFSYSLPEIDLGEAKTVYRNVTTINGFQFDVTKSGLQKYIRRGLPHKAMRMAAEMDLLKYLPGSQTSTTNFHNRLKITFLEDIGLACPGLIFTLDERLECLKLQHRVLSQELMTMVNDMALSPHSRYFSHVRFSSIERPFTESKKPEYHHPLGKDEDLREVVDNLVWCLEHKEVHGWHFAEKIFAVEKLKERRFGASLRPGMLVLEIVSHFLGPSPVFEVCLKWYRGMKMKEQFLCCMLPMYIFIFGTKVEIPPITFAVSMKAYYEALRRHPFVIDDFILDKHTLQGRSMKKNIGDFAIDGSLVAYDVKVDEKMRKAYTFSKVSEIRKESAEFIFKARAQLVCAASRPDTYFAQTLTGHHVVVKGPYATYDETMKIFNTFTLGSLFPGVNVPTMGIKVLYADLLRAGPNRTCLGSRLSIREDIPSYFIVMEDLFQSSIYPTEMKESKVWESTEVVDYEEFFRMNPFIGFGKTASIDDDTILSMLLQLAFRYTFKLGDFAVRNFIRVFDQVYNVDLSGVGINNVIRFSSTQIKDLRRVLHDREDDYTEVLDEWVNDTQKWDLVGLVCTDGDKYRQIMRELLANPSMLLE